MDATAGRTENLLLDALSPDERIALLRGARRRPIRVGDLWRSPGDRIEFVTFPTSGILSLVVEPDGGRVEAATIGREGAGDVHAALGSRIGSQTLLAQLEGEAIDVGIETFDRVYQQGSRLRRLIHGYIEALLIQTTISAACLAVHHLNQRCARWLLQTHDRGDSDTFELKQEFLATMLGVRRPSVSVAAAALQASGSIGYRRGKITVLDRGALETASCSCYEWMRLEYSRLVPLHERGRRG